MKKFLALAVMFIAGLIFVGNAIRGTAQTKSGEHIFVFEMTAQKYEYAPDIVHVKQGTRVQLKIVATDRKHGFKIRLYPEGSPEKSEPGLRMAGGQNDFKLEENKEQVIEFFAERPGTYVFRCSVFCGMGHRGMTGKVIVE